MLHKTRHLIHLFSNCVKSASTISPSYTSSNIRKVMTQPLNFNNRVVLVTGAGNGLGREYALAFGSRGAKVVVNDLGGDMKGEGKSSRAADVVVEEIRSKGGTAVANYDSVEDGEKVVKTALDNFGRIDVVVNNAGILRDKSFTRISDADWDIIHRVHVRGAFLVTRAAWPHMRKQNFGRVIMVSSASGIYGNFGQTNYSAAKMGVFGMANTLALEGKKYNILCNVIAPIALSRMTEALFPGEMVDLFKAEYVAPIVVWLGHESCEDTGGLFECGGGWFAKLRFTRCLGAALIEPGSAVTPELVRDNWETITDFSNAEHYGNMQEANMKAMMAIQERKNSPKSKVMKLAAGSSTSIVPEKAIGARLKDGHFSYTSRDVVLYALGVGMSASQPDYLRFLFEMSDGFSVLPTFAILPSLSTLMKGESVDGLAVDPTKILHGEQYVELFRPLQPEDTFTTKVHVADVVDKKKGALIVYNADTFNAKGEKVAFNQIVSFVTRAGGFGGKTSSSVVKPSINPPNRPPDASVQQKTTVDQAALYRLSGDPNPLHIDPSFAAMGGFETPILHGLCTLGHAARHVLAKYCENDVSKFKAMKVRFTSPMLPGQTVQTDMWKEGSRIFLQCKVVETGKVCISGAYVDMTGDISTTIGDMPESLQTDLIFTEMNKKLMDNPSLVSGVNAILQYNITKDGKVAANWTLDCKNGASVYKGTPKQGSAQCTVTVSDENFMDIIQGKLNGQQAFMTGKLKAAGDFSCLIRLSKLFEAQAKM